MIYQILFFIAAICAVIIVICLLIILANVVRGQEMGMLFLNSSEYCYDHYDNDTIVCHHIGMNMTK